MGREIWGTYSVNDHLARGAFLGDLMFYDKLVLPVPDPGTEAEWDKEGWAPDLQAELIAKLAEHDRVKTVPWAVGRWAAERETLADYFQRDAFLWTRAELLKEVPTSVRGVTPIPTFTRAEDLREATGVRKLDGDIVPDPMARLAADMTLRFLVPEVDRQIRPEDLEAVLARTADREHKKARDAFWHWVRDYFGDDVVTDQAALDRAAEEMADLVADLERATRWGKVKTAGQYLFLMGSVAVAAMAGPLSPAGIAGIGLTVGRFGFDKLTRQADIKPTPEAALFVTRRRGLPFRRAGRTT